MLAAELQYNITDRQFGSGQQNFLCAFNRKAFSFSEYCIFITVWMDVKIEAVYWTWSWRWLRGSWSTDSRPSPLTGGWPRSCCWAAPAPPTGAASAVSPPSSLSSTVRYLQDLQYLQCPHHAMSRVTAGTRLCLTAHPMYLISICDTGNIRELWHVWTWAYVINRYQSPSMLCKKTPAKVGRHKM